MRQLLEKYGVSALFLAGVVAACYCMKAYYSGATPSGLRFILLPTGALVQGLSGHKFQFEPGVGVASSSAQVAITRACAGVNFLIVVFAVLAAVGILRLKRAWQKWTWAVGAALVAFGATLVVNTVRICLALQIHREHRLLGTAVYVVGLCVVFAAAQSLLDGRGGVVSAARWLPLPLGLYLGMTLVVPAFRGAAGNGEYLPHALVVVGTTVVMGGLFKFGLAALARS